MFKLDVYIRLKSSNCYDLCAIAQVSCKYIMSFLYSKLNLCKTTTLKRPKIGFQDQLSLNTGQKYPSLIISCY